MMNARCIGGELGGSAQQYTGLTVHQGYMQHFIRESIGHYDLSSFACSDVPAQRIMFREIQSLVTENTDARET